MDDIQKDPRYAFCGFLAAQLDELEQRALVLAEDYIHQQEEHREREPSRRLSGVYLAVRREPRNGRLQIGWRKSKFVDNSPLSMRATGRQFVKSRHVHRCPSEDLSYSIRNIKTAVNYGAPWEFQLVWGFEQRAAVLRGHASLIEDLKKSAMSLEKIQELVY